MRTVPLYGVGNLFTGVARTASILLDALKRICTQTVYIDSGVRLCIISAEIDNKFVTREPILKKHSFLSASLADSRLPSWNEDFWGYHWNCNYAQRCLNCAKDRGEQEAHIDPIIMPHNYDKYLEHLQVENHCNNFRHILVPMRIHLFPVLNASKHLLVCDTSPPGRLCWKQRVPCKLNNVTFIVIAWILAPIIWLRVNAGGLLNTCKSKQAFLSISGMLQTRRDLWLDKFYFSGSCLHFFAFIETL